MSDYELVPMPGLELDRNDYRTNLEYYQKLSRLTTTQLSERSDVNIRTLRYLIAGYRDINQTSALTVYRIAKVLNCTVEDLLEK
jgi:hypothetical protein